MNSNENHPKLNTAKSLEQSPFFMMGVVHRHFRNQAQKELMANYDITTEVLKALEVVHCFEPMSQQKLADALMNERSATKRLVDNLIKRNLITAIKDINNQKHKLLTLSEEGKIIRKHGDVIMQRLEKKWLSSLKEEEIKSIISICNKLSSNI